MDDNQHTEQPATRPGRNSIVQCSISAVCPRDRRANLHIRSTTSITRAVLQETSSSTLAQPAPEHVDAAPDHGNAMELSDGHRESQSQTDQKKLHQLAVVPVLPESKVSEPSMGSSIDLATESGITDHSNRNRRTTGRLVIAPEPLAGLRDKHSESDKSSSLSENGLLRRPSLGWGQRVSMNTPVRRSSEHEVNWVDLPEVPLSVDSSDSGSEEEEVEPRASVVINMDDKGRKISISLAQVDREIREYLADIPDDIENATQSSMRSMAKSNDIVNDLISDVVSSQG